MKYARKSLPAYNIKAIDGQNGIVEAYCSVFNNVDYSGEIIRPGFFAETIAEANTKGGDLPTVLWSHDMWQPPIGMTIEAEEVLPYDGRLPESIRSLGGLRVVGQMDMSSEFSRSVFNKILMGALRKYSIGYYVLQDMYDRETGVVELLKGDWIEWSPVNFAANDETLTVGAKGANGKSDPRVTQNEHIFVVHKSRDFEDGSYRRVERESGGRKYIVVTGKLRATGATEEATLRFDADAWSVDDVKSLCADNSAKGSLEIIGKGAATDVVGVERLADHGARVVAQLSAYVARVEDVREKRLADGKAGRVLSEANRNILAGLIPDLQSATDRVQKLLDDTADGGKSGSVTDEARKLHARMLSMQTELYDELVEVAS